MEQSPRRRNFGRKDPPRAMLSEKKIVRADVPRANWCECDDAAEKASTTLASDSMASRFSIPRWEYVAARPLVFSPGVSTTSSSGMSSSSNMLGSRPDVSYWVRLCLSPAVSSTSSSGTSSSSTALHSWPDVSCSVRLRPAVPVSSGLDVPLDVSC